MMLFRTVGIILVVGLLTLVACAPYVQHSLDEPLQSPLLETARFITADGEILPVRTWLPKGEPRSIVIGVHGFNDYSRAFAKVGTYLAQQGVAVYAYDQRGFGATRQRGKWPGVELLVKDLRAFIRAVGTRHRNRPLYLLGESMGGAVAMVALAGPEALLVDRLILVAPAVWGGQSLNSWYRSLLWVSAHTLPWLKLTGSSLKIKASDNREMLKRMRADPLIIKETRIDALYGMVQLMDKARKVIPQLHMPTLVLYGGRDQVIPERPICHLLEELPGPHSVAFYPAGYHMLLRDREAERVWQDLVAWLQVPVRMLNSRIPARCLPLLAQTG
ncbi:alpha/beta hydrolase [Nitrosococcus watsonii]|nr:alpha/beta hydrolase [Nitrosococcus watsonii]